MTPSKPDVFEGASGVRIPGSLADSLVPLDRLRPNPWNPNKMDGFTREKLERSIRTDGFILPLLVRPLPHEDTDSTRRDYDFYAGEWQIVDGEHRWRVGREAIGMERMPVVDLGRVTDSEAKAITVKANALRGEFDTLGLARMVEELIADADKASVVAALPFTEQRIDAMLSLIHEGTLGQDLLNGVSGGAGLDDVGSAAAGDDGDDFRSFDPEAKRFRHTCPQCGFQFDGKK